MDNKVFIIEFIDKFLNSSTVAVIIGALIAGYFGFKQYRSQKIWENINKRYFEDGIEDLIACLHSIRKSSEDSYANSIIVLKYFRKLSKEDFKNWFKSFSPDNKKISYSMPKSFFITQKIFENKSFDKLCASIFRENAEISDSFVSQVSLISEKYRNDSQLIRKGNLYKEELLNRKYTEEYKKVFDKTLLTIEILEKILLRLRKINIDSYEKLKEAKNDKVIKNILLEAKKLKL